MAAMAFESSLSSSVRRASTAVVPSTMAETLPSINFGFEDLRDRMAKFTARFDDFIEKGRKRVLEERNQFRMSVAELQEDQRMRRRDMEILSLKASAHNQTLQKEYQETSEMQSAIAAVTAQRDERAAHRDRLKQQIADTQKAITQRVDAQKEHARHLDNQSRFNVPELDFWQDYLGLRIEGAGVSDHIKFVYTHIDEKDWEREAWFELVMDKREYEIGHCKPKIDKERADAIVEKLNETRDLRILLKGMRVAFIEAMK
ncbi:hypothetical protein L228DRAFT_258932 [Xylona heveae TC161]|uniref:Kinetochore protein SPC25 n=1 Tax=Xylona heveae (strain CBS 132557 / TC161) TaxID=1328760 RepID=A0A165IXS7_XYLHT|nr:hypothetical protein L228DRAFT_258932 [Xylona heveae TC161]KZF25520.1 hypothetical protein L228DRAFT_258932 [Xylona heveae TC161]